MIQAYVGGYAFSRDRELVLLVEKGHGPPLNIGKWNGIGGKVDESDESSRHAQAREFLEETGIETHPKDWEPIARQLSPGIYVIDWYAIDLPLEIFLSHKPLNDDFDGEVIRPHEVRTAMTNASHLAELTLVHLALAIDPTIRGSSPSRMATAPILDVTYIDPVVAGPGDRGGEDGFRG